MVQLPTLAVLTVQLPTQAVGPKRYPMVQLPTQAVPMIQLPTQAVPMIQLPTQAVEGGRSGFLIFFFLSVCAIAEIAWLTVLAWATLSFARWLFS
jgi:hypothetical protein